MCVCMCVCLLSPQVLVKSTGERCYYPNTRLITLPVVNLTRSVARSEKVLISLNVGQASNAAREALLVRGGGGGAWGRCFGVMCPGYGCAGMRLALSPSVLGAGCLHMPPAQGCLPGAVLTLQAAVKEHYEENESDFNSCPSVNFVNLVRGTAASTDTDTCTS